MNLMEVESNVYVLWVSRSLTCEKMNFWILIDTWWFEKLYETWWIMFIKLKLKLYRNIYIASLPCYLFVFVSLSVMIGFYTGANEIAGNRAPQWTTGGWDTFHLNALFCFENF